jgi:hypothetical protein
MIRTATAASLLLLLGACNVQSDEANGTTSVTLDTDAAKNTAEAAADQAQTIGGHIANDVKETGEKIDNRVDVDVDVNANASGNGN